MGSILSWYAFKNTPKPTVVTGVLENVTDSLTLHVRVFTGSHPTLIVLYCYGNLETVERQAGYLQLFVTFTGVTVVAFDYPGFGASPGKPTEGRLNHAGVAMLDWIERRFPDPNRKVIVWGRSLGTTVATYIASNAEVHGVLLESPLCSGFRYGLNLNISGGCFDFFDTLTRAKNDASEWGKILIIHGKEDTEIRIWQAELLAEVCTENNPATTFIPLKNRGHNTISLPDVTRLFYDVYVKPLEDEEEGGGMKPEEEDEDEMSSLMVSVN